VFGEHRPVADFATIAAQIPVFRVESRDKTGHQPRPHTTTNP
jgi:hypothetical protein